MTFVETIAIALLPAIGAIGLWLFQRRERADERAENRSEAHKQLRRLKAEEVFQELNKLQAAHSERITYALSLIANKEIEVTSDSSTSHLDALLSIYFPDRLPLLQAYEVATEQLYRNAGEMLTDSAKKGEPVEEQNKINFILSNELNKCAVKLSKELRSAMRTEIDKLWETKPAATPSAEPSAKR